MWSSFVRKILRNINLKSVWRLDILITKYNRKTKEKVVSFCRPTHPTACAAAACGEMLPGCVPAEPGPMGRFACVAPACVGQSTKQ